MILFTPSRGQILMCDFDMATVMPEMRKKRRVVVVSPKGFNGRHGQQPGKCVVVPFSATPPRYPSGTHVPFPVGLYASLTVPTWAICEAVDHVSHIRLDRVAAGRVFLSERISDADMARIEAGLRLAQGM